ncbi:MAG: DUF72 domain-containing protein [bacterium]
MEKKKRPFHVGTSGWQYGHWKGPFYPSDLPQKAFLAFYSQRFSTVEINGSFYRLPDASALERWRETTPPEFLFTMKASRFITHMKKLKDPEEPVARLTERAAVLEKKLGPILFQLPPRWRCDLERLRSFLEVLPEGLRYAFEFRDPSWFDPRVYDLLRKRNGAFCIYELAGKRSPEVITSDFVYLRLHGPDGAYQGRYGTQGLSGLAKTVAAWAAEGKEIYCYFDNDQAGYAVQDALCLREMLG